VFCSLPPSQLASYHNHALVGPRAFVANVSQWPTALPAWSSPEGVATARFVALSSSDRLAMQPVCGWMDVGGCRCADICRERERTVIPLVCYVLSVSIVTSPSHQGVAIHTAAMPVIRLHDLFGETAIADDTTVCTIVTTPLVASRGSLVLSGHSLAVTGGAFMYICVCMTWSLSLSLSLSVSLSSFSLEKNHSQVRVKLQPSRPLHCRCGALSRLHRDWCSRHTAQLLHSVRGPPRCVLVGWSALLWWTECIILVVSRSPSYSIHHSLLPPHLFIPPFPPSDAAA
jgi:hypothetical protein